MRVEKRLRVLRDMELWKDENTVDSRLWSLAGDSVQCTEGIAQSSSHQFSRTLLLPVNIGTDTKLYHRSSFKVHCSKYSSICVAHSLFGFDLRAFHASDRVECRYAIQHLRNKLEMLSSRTVQISLINEKILVNFCCGTAGNMSVNDFGRC